jgi:hypothetical protein
VKTMLAAVVVLTAVAFLPGSASAATCSEYSTQADAQRAADTRDADGDGIYCETLPCPCLKTGSSSPATPPPPPPPPPPAVSARFSPGPSISFGPRTRSSGCQIRGPLPDPACTPGARFKNADRAHVCKPGYSKTVRNVPQSVKNRVYAEYGITSHNRATYEVDHLVPLELGGSNSIANLFPEAASPKPGYHEKDRLENKAHDRVCDGARSLRATQRSIATDWTILYHTYFG